jgi:hypothetical protein
MDRSNLIWIRIWVHELWNEQCFDRGNHSVLSLNDFIEREHCSVQYSSIDDAVKMIHDLGRNALLAKCDIKSTFRLLRLAPSEFDLTGFNEKLIKSYYIDPSPLFHRIKNRPNNAISYYYLKLLEIEFDTAKMIMRLPSEKLN